QPLVAAVAHRLFGRALARAEPDLLGGRRLELDGCEVCHFVRTVAKRLALRQSAGAPPIALAGLHLDRDRRAATDRGHLARRIAHELRPPPSVASHASPQALASSRTRKI